MVLLPSRSRSSSSLAILVLVCTHVQWVDSLYDPTTKIESARLYGNVDSYAYYYVDLGVGSPSAQTTSVIVDTGSTIAGFPCASCSHCGHHIDPPFNFAASKSASWLGCSDGCTAGCANGKCSYSQTYTEGSSIKGWWFQDYVQLGDLAQSNPAVMAQLGCHQQENKLFYTQRANGILGLAPYQSGRPTILTDLFKDTAHVNNNIFSMCLAVWGGKLNVGGYNTSYHTGSLHWIPLMLNRYYEVTPDSLSLDGQVLAQGAELFGNAMVDSGTTYTYFPEKVFSKLDAALHSYCQMHNSCGALPAGPCWELNAGKASPDEFPSLAFGFGGGVTVYWHPTSYLYQRGNSNKWCKAYASNGFVPSTVLGATWMLGKEVIFDLTTSRLGIVEANCPEYRRGNRALSPSGKNLDTPPVVVPAISAGHVGFVEAFSPACFFAVCAISACFFAALILAVPAARALCHPGIEANAVDEVDGDKDTFKKLNSQE